MTTIVDIEQLVFRWNKKQAMCLDIPSLNIQSGESVFIHGASGSGKSTLLCLLGGVLTPERGSINMLGQDIVSMTGACRDRFRADHVGFLFQQFNLVPYLSALDNVLLPCRFSSRRREMTLCDGGPETVAKYLLQRLDLSPNLWDQKSTSLSVGQQQRVALARTLIGKPEILIADEPTSALDNNRQEAFLDLLLENCQLNQSTLLFVSHNHQLQTRFSRNISLAEINRANDFFSEKPLC